MTSPGTFGIPARLQAFEPSFRAAQQRLDSISPAAYSRSRNALDGAVTGLSPYLTHGLLSLPKATRSVHSRHFLSFDDKLVFEFGWREFFHHVWERQKNADAILQDMHGAATWPGRYADTLPPDVRHGCTGVAAIDNAVRILYATGYLHNHARMYLASYLVHVRKVRWRVGADWLYGHLLDGDLPSNHLSWQWVAGTFSSKPYLFNAENVLKFAPVHARASWDCSGTVIDKSYEALDLIARNKPGAGPEPGDHEKVPEPPLLDQFLPSNMALAPALNTQEAIEKIANKDLELIHPWSLSQPAAPGGSHRLRLGIIDLPAHKAWPWSERRWRFVLGAMSGVTDAIWIGDLAELDVTKARAVTAQATLFPGYRQALSKMATLTPIPRLLPSPAMACKSFSKFYERARGSTDQLADLL